MKHRLAITLTLLAILCISSRRHEGLAAAAHHISGLLQTGDIKLLLGSPQVVSTYQERQNFGFQFGYTDGVMGSVADESNYLYFGSAKSATEHCNAQADSPQTQGVYRLTPEAVNPLRIAKARCRALLRPSGTHPGVHPQGIMGPFDRDYLGGGPVMRISDGKRSGILITYHAEFQYGQPRKDKA